MKCLTIAQPWASMIIVGEKDVECRTWQTTHRGLLLIHAAKDASVRKVTMANWRKAGAHKYLAPSPLDLALGAILGTVELVDCLPRAKCRSEWKGKAPWCWVLKNPRPLAEPIPCTGQLGLWNAPENVLETVSRLLEV